MPGFTICSLRTTPCWRRPHRESSMFDRIPYEPNDSSTNRKNRMFLDDRLRTSASPAGWLGGARQRQERQPQVPGSQAAEALRQETRAATDMDVVALLRLPGVITGVTAAVPEGKEEQEGLGRLLDGGLRDALAKLDDMRRAEGRHLVEELRNRLGRISGHVEQVRGLATTLRPAFSRRLDAKLKELLGGTGIDLARLAQEAALLAERSDISEELDRLRSHLQQFGKLLDGAGEMGKKLDFLLQEMHREANTMLSKTPGVESEALAITGLALEIKAEIEKLREQVQNIE